MSTIYSKLFENQELSTTQKKIIEIVGKDKKVLEIGCASGYMTRLFLANNCAVDVVEINSDDLKQAKKYARKSLPGSIEDKKIQQQITEKYDFIICADVLEHTVNPEKVLQVLKRNLIAAGKILISMPNIASWGMRLNLLKGNFEYQDSGILDKTHLRFFTFYSLQNLLKLQKYKIIEIYPTEEEYPFRKVILNLFFIGKRIDRVMREFLYKNFPNLTVYHFIIEAKND